MTWRLVKPVAGYSTLSRFVSLRVFPWISITESAMCSPYEELKSTTHMAAYPFDSRPFCHVSSNFLPFMSVQPVGGPMKSRILKLSILILLLTILSAAQDAPSFETRITVKQFANGLTSPTYYRPPPPHYPSF